MDLKCSTAAEGPTYYRECLAKAGEIRQRPNRLEVGDRVSVCLEADVVQAMAQGHGGWQSSMADVSNARIYPILGFHTSDKTAMLVYKAMAKCRSSFA